jgi:hypothetical protein
VVKATTVAKSIGHAECNPEKAYERYKAEENVAPQDELPRPRARHASASTRLVRSLRAHRLLRMPYATSRAAVLAIRSESRPRGVQRALDALCQSPPRIAQRPDPTRARSATGGPGRDADVGPRRSGYASRPKRPVGVQNQLMMVEPQRVDVSLLSQELPAYMGPCRRFSPPARS